MTFQRCTDWCRSRGVFDSLEKRTNMKFSYVLAISVSATILAGCQTNWWENHPAPEQISLNQLPPAAQATIRNEIGNQPIARLTKEWKYGAPAYRVEVERTGMNPSLWVAADGSIITESRSLVAENEKAKRQIYESAGAQGPAKAPKRSASQGY